MATYIKDPDALLDYQIDWSSWLVADTISASSWEAKTGIVVDSDSETTTTTTVWLSGGTVGTKYKITNHITTAAGREDDRSFYIIVKEK